MTSAADDQERQCRLDQVRRCLWVRATVGAVLFVWLMVQVISGVKW